MYYSTATYKYKKMNIISKSKKHCENANENYFRHMFVAFKISLGLFGAGLMAFVHSIIPAFFEKGASSKIINLYNYLNSKKRVKNEN